MLNSRLAEVPGIACRQINTDISDIIMSCLMKGLKGLMWLTQCILIDLIGGFSGRRDSKQTWPQSFISQGNFLSNFLV